MLKAMQEDNRLSRDLKPSQELLDKIVEARELAKSFGKSATEIVRQAYELAIRDGFHPLQARDFLMAQLPFISERTIRLALPAEAKDQTKVRNRIDNSSSNLRQIAANTDNPNIVNITTKAEIKDAELVQEPEAEEPSELELAQIEIQQLKDALHKTQQFTQATQLQEQPTTSKDPTPELQLTDDLVFQYLRDRAKETGNILIIDRVGAGALVQALAQYKNSFGVAELFLRVIK